jgi:hypothetical protein
LILIIFVTIYLVYSIDNSGSFKVYSKPYYLGEKDEANDLMLSNIKPSSPITVTFITGFRLYSLPPGYSAKFYCDDNSAFTINNLTPKRVKVNNIGKSPKIHKLVLTKAT